MASTNTSLPARAADLTFWESVALSKWGAYITELERKTIVQGQALAGTPTNALEVGCEGGRWSKLLSDFGWQMTCIDVDEPMLDVCQRRLPGAKCILAKPRDETIPCDSSSVALLLCIEVAPVIQSDWFLPESQRVLTKDGVLAGVFWNLMSWRGLLTQTRYRLSGRGRNENFYSRSYPAYRRNLGRAGFRLVFEEGFCWGSFRRASNSPLIPLFTKFEHLSQLHRLTSISPWVVFIARKTESV